MSKYPEYISEKRRPSPTPKNLVENGNSIWGTFDAPIPNINLLDCKKPAGKLLPHCLNKFKLTIWEAFEVMFDEGIFLSAVYNVGFGGFSIFVFYDKRTKKINSWFNLGSAKKCIVADNLINKKTQLIKKNSSIVIDNQFQNGKAYGVGKAHNKKGDIEFDLKIEKISQPSIVNIPFDKNRPLYSEKDLFKAEGYLIINGEKINTNSNTTAIIDDHKGYYPHKAHYDWLTTMGKTKIDGIEQYFGFNLTYNQSTNQDDYNENLIWLKNKSFPLPPVKFENGGNDQNSQWSINDEFDTVNIKFNIGNCYKIQIHLGLIDVDYNLPFGTITGYVRDHEGKKYIVDGMSAIGEDKSTIL